MDQHTDTAQILTNILEGQCFLCFNYYGACIYILELVN